MKAALNIVGAALLLLSASSSSALPPRPHSARGLVQTIDTEAHTFTVATEDNQSLVFVWKDYTRFIYRRSRVCYGALKPGLAVKISYRSDIGRLVPYWAYLPRDAEVRCECCAKPS